MKRFIFLLATVISNNERNIVFFWQIFFCNHSRISLPAASGADRSSFLVEMTGYKEKRIAFLAFLLVFNQHTLPVKYEYPNINGMVVCWLQANKGKASCATATVLADVYYAT
ncbi:MAG: hypothetical protein U0T77_00610 [Chitinophagales bacterium]